MAQGAPKLTYDDLLLLPDDGRRHEIIDGAPLVTPAALEGDQLESPLLPGLEIPLVVVFAE